MSSLKDLASLIMVPSLYKDGELHTVKPLADENIIVHPDATDNNDGVDGTTPSTSSNFTFSRGSNLAATRVDVNGLIEKGRENVLLQSNQFDTTWAKHSQVTLTSGQTGYDGSSDAWLFDKAATSYRWIRQTGLSNAGVQTLSAYFKAGTLNEATLYLDVTSGGSNPYVKFNLTTGAAVESSNEIESNSVDVGNGWWRLSMTINGTIADARIYAGWSDAVAGTIYIQDAQLEQGLVATDYIETTTTSVSAGILEDMPRLDYSGGASCPSLLLEPQRTNAVDYSEGGFAFQGSISGTGVTPVITENAAISPQGVQNAFRVDLDRGAGNTSGDWSWIYQNGIAYSGENQISVYLKAATSSDIGKEVAIRYGGSASPVTLTADWKRYYVTRTLTATSEIGLYSRGGENADNAVSCYVYGWQVENNSSYPTSYIPTYGTSQTRSSDRSFTLDTGIDSNVGTWYLEMKSFQSGNYGSGSPSILINATSGSAYISILSNQVANTMRCRVHNNTTANYVGGSFPPTDVNKFAFKWDGTTFKFFRNGAEYSSIPFSTSVVFSIMNLPDISRAGLFPINQTLCFPTALTDSECIALTTL